MYNSIAAYYDFIFPLKKTQLDFTQKYIPHGCILDIGCATGNLAAELAGKFNVTAIDLDEDMIHLAKAKSGSVDFRVHDMTHLQIFPAAHFNGVVCYGNTVVHLITDELIFDFFHHVQRLLKPDGVFLIQLLNYEKILQENITKLPLIENEHIRFERTYSPINNLLNFHTRLLVKSENCTIENTLSLYPITRARIVKLLQKAGFLDIACFGDFLENPVEGLPLVVKCRADKSKY